MDADEKGWFVEFEGKRTYRATPEEAIKAFCKDIEEQLLMNISVYRTAWRQGIVNGADPGPGPTGKLTPNSRN